MTTKIIPLTPSLMDYIAGVSIQEHPALQACREYTATLSEVSIMQIPPIQGGFLRWLVATLGVRRAIEIGTFTGYSALSIALSLPPDGKLIACDINDEWTSQAKRFWKQAQVDQKIDLRLAPATETLAKLKYDEPFDFVFIDADKKSYPAYYEASLALLRRGGVIAVDNVLQEGRVADKNDHQSNTVALRDFNEKLKLDARVQITLLTIADGLTLIRKL